MGRNTITKKPPKIVTRINLFEDYERKSENTAPVRVGMLLSDFPRAVGIRCGSPQRRGGPSGAKKQLHPRHFRDSGYYGHETSFEIAYICSMKLPNAQNAVIAIAKISQYLLSESHAVGRSKARFFAMRGTDQVNQMHWLRISLARNEDVSSVVETDHGTDPRFVTAYPAN